MNLTQVPLRQALEFKALTDGKYEFEFPLSVCFGACASYESKLSLVCTRKQLMSIPLVVAGGLVLSAIHRAAVDFVSHDPRTCQFPNVSNISVQFYRPTLPTPRKFFVELRISNVNKAGATLHVEVIQKKTTIAGYISMGDLTQDSNGFAGLDCKLIPPPLPTTVSNLENDVDDGWVGYCLPFELGHNRWGSTYIRYNMNKQMQSPHFVDQWLRPGWKDEALPNGPVWNNELVHCLLDSSTPLWLDPATRADVYQKSIQAGLKQSKARREGTSEVVEGGDLAVPYIVATLTMQTTVRRLLPPEGEKWLLMRATTTGHVNNRADFYLILLNPAGEVVATCNQVMQLVPHASKVARL